MAPIPARAVMIGLPFFCDRCFGRTDGLRPGRGIERATGPREDLGE
jgi:hypothetical protein